jgi:hypothetical protein
VTPEAGATYAASDRSRHPDAVLGHFAFPFEVVPNSRPDVVVGAFDLEGNPRGSVRFRIFGHSQADYRLCPSSLSEPPYDGMNASFDHSPCTPLATPPEGRYYTNSWDTWYESPRYEFRAGGVASDPSNGFVEVWRDHGNGPVFLRHVPTAFKFGLACMEKAERIPDDTTFRLTVKTDAGRTFTFLTNGDVFDLGR